MKIDLKGKIILVTGASRGIGKGIAKSLGESGATVAVHYNNNNTAAVKLAKNIGNGSKAFQADLEQSTECKKLFQKVIDEYGRLDVLINNAGIFKLSPLESIDWESDWDKTLNINLKAAALLSRLAILHFQENNIAGKIINISSRAAFRGDDPEYLAYAASKAGMVALTKSIARGYGKDNITSFLVAPGWVETDMSKPSLDQMGMKTAVKSLALNKLTRPEDIAPVIVLLSSGLADHATGTTIDINAGSYAH